MIDSTLIISWFHFQAYYAVWYEVEYLYLIFRIELKMVNHYYFWVQNRDWDSLFSQEKNLFKFLISYLNSKVSVLMVFTQSSLCFSEDFNYLGKPIEAIFFVVCWFFSVWWDVLWPDEALSTHEFNFFRVLLILWVNLKETSTEHSHFL